MGPLTNEARAAADSLTASASLETVSFCMSSSSTLMLLAFSAWAAALEREGILLRRGIVCVWEEEIGGGDFFFL